MDDKAQSNMPHMTEPHDTGKLKDKASSDADAARPAAPTIVANKTAVVPAAPEPGKGSLQTDADKTPPPGQMNPVKEAAAEPKVPSRSTVRITPDIETPTPAPGSAHTLDIKDAFRKWLESKTKEELVELVLDIEKKSPDLEITRKMIQSDPAITPQSYRVPENITFTRLPVISKAKPDEPPQTWRLVLVNIDSSYKPIGLDIDGEITVGRATADTEPDLDLMPYGASTKGVSRIHARIRPSQNSLVLLDEKSTNGTYCNKIQITTADGEPLKDNDIVTFGRANFMIKILKSPGSRPNPA